MRLISLPLLFALGCAPAADPQEPDELSCEAALNQMSSCYPELENEARCNEQSLAQFEAAGLEQEGCEAAEDLGKADFFSIGGCGEGEHICGWLFCCDGYALSWAPSSESDWDILEVVAAFQREIPQEIQAKIESQSLRDLLEGSSFNWLQTLAEYPDKAPVEMAVERSQLLVEIDYEQFIAQLSPELWGLNLAHYLGGEIQVYKRDAEGRALRQVERMVLSPLPCDLETPLSNNDMTKVEVIRYTEESARIDWRVMYSDNRSTETDVGSLSFESYAGGTLITFHSAHRLSLPGGLHIPNPLILTALSATFLDHARRYRSLTTD